MGQVGRGNGLLVGRRGELVEYALCFNDLVGRGLLRNRRVLYGSSRKINKAGRVRDRDRGLPCWLPCRRRKGGRKSRCTGAWFVRRIKRRWTWIKRQLRLCERSQASRKCSWISKCRRCSRCRCGRYIGRRRASRSRTFGCLRRNKSIAWLTKSGNISPSRSANI